MGVRKTVAHLAARPAASLVLLPLAENLRIYLYQLADAGALSRDEADALVTGERSLADIPHLPAGPALFVRDCLARLSP